MTMTTPFGNESPPSIPGNPDLLAQGWERRHLADEDRAHEAAESYRQMGFEVRVEKLSPEDFGPKCGSCSSVVCSSYVLIYTRKASTGNDQPNT